MSRPLSLRSPGALQRLSLWLACAGLGLLRAAAQQQVQFTPVSLARQANLNMQKGEKKLGRGLLSLALHLDPFLFEMPEFGGWLPQLLLKEPRSYWKGSAFIGHDKTYLESLFPKQEVFASVGKNFQALLAWRNLQLTGLSCCGIDNVAVFFQQANRHMYLVPFVDLVPGAAQGLKPDNLKMYRSFRQWWEETGRRPMPEPSVKWQGGGHFEWDAMKVAFKASRVPKGWAELVEAVLAHILGEPGAAATLARHAVRLNSELAPIIRDFLPTVGGEAPVSPAATVPTTGQQYVVCYNPHVGLGNLAVVMVSAHMLAKLTGRTFVLHWNVNVASRSAFQLVAQPGVELLSDYTAREEGVFSGSVRHIYFFHMMNSEKLGEALELLGCSDLRAELADKRVVTVSSNLFFAPVLAVNPHTPPDAVPGFPELLRNLLRPSEAAARRALDFARSVSWGRDVPVVAIHIRAREEGEDNDDWPTATSPNRGLLEKLAACVQIAVSKEIGSTGGWWPFQSGQWDAYIASTTEAARSAVEETLKSKAPGLRRVLQLKPLLNRRVAQGAEDAMAEALLISRASVLVRLVVGTSGFSTFAYLSNALRIQNEWVASEPSLHRSTAMPNFLVTEDCGPGRCFMAPTDVRMASIGWHGPKYTRRSCGDVVQNVERKGTSQLGCRGLRPVDTTGQAGAEL